MPRRDWNETPVEDLTEKQAKAEHVRLAAEIAEHDRRYYQEDAPTVSDAEYDRLRLRYGAIEARFPQLHTLESLTQRVGAAPSGRFAKVRHAVPMLSLDNAFAEQDVIDFVGRIRRFLRLPDGDEIAFSAEPKIDGLSMSLRYENGELVTAATRGDGAEGEDVTANVKTLKDIPHRLKRKSAPAVCEVRGEIYMTKQDGASIGPFAHLRPGSEIGERAHVGNFVETKKARLGKGAKANHLSYLGDAEIGAGSNIGAGTITCNYDGASKHRTYIGKNAFVGSDSTLVAPVSVGDGAYIGAGTCITKDVPADALAVGRSRQIIKKNWAAERRAKRETKGVHS